MLSHIHSVSKKILVALAIIFLIQVVFKLPFVELFGLRDIRAETFSFYQIFTHMFIHANLGHLIRNGFGLWIFGSTLESALGKKNYITLLIITGLGSALLHLFITYINVNMVDKTYGRYLDNPTIENYNSLINLFPYQLKKHYQSFTKAYREDPENVSFKQKGKKIAEELAFIKRNTPSVGSSGVVFGFLTGFSMLFPNQYLYFLFFPIAIKAKYIAFFYALYELYEGSKNNPSDNVAHFAHLGGILFAYIFMRFLRKTKYVKKAI